MATAMKKCRVCGKEYEACHTLKHTAGVFRWQEVACSQECGSIYLAAIRESRKTNQVSAVKATDTKPPKILVEEDVDEEELDKELAEYFDDAEDTAI